MLTKMKKQTEKGFTLIELMIVVAIIGILAAIAIPQFASYRTKAFNSAAMSDLHTARLAEEALFADYQTYGASVSAAGLNSATAIAAGVGGAAVTASATAGSEKGFIAGLVVGQSSPFSLSKGVTLQAEMDANATATVPASFATVTAQHAQGDKVYAAETDQSGTYQKPVTVGTQFAPVGAATGNLDAASPFAVM